MYARSSLHRFCGRKSLNQWLPQRSSPVNGKKWWTSCLISVCSLFCSITYLFPCRLKNKGLWRSECFDYVPNAQGKLCGSLNYFSSICSVAQAKKNVLQIHDSQRMNHFVFLWYLIFFLENLFFSPIALIYDSVCVCVCCVCAFVLYALNFECI